MADDNLNLTPERGPNVWKKTERASSAREAWKSAVSGAVMVAAGAAAAVVGGRMLLRAVRGSAESPTATRPGGVAVDIVGEESEQSFPASDSPSWTPTEGANTQKGKTWR